MTVVVTPLSGSEKLCLREVFASIQDSGSLSGYIRTYGIDSRSVSKLGSFVMENGLLDRVEGNADVYRWSKQTQQENGDNIIMGYVSELLDYTRISVNEHLFRALAQFWNPAYSCFTFGEVDLVPTVEEYTTLFRCLRFQSDRIYSRAACVPTFWKKLMTITGMSEQWITARIKEKGERKCISWDALKDLILTHPDETTKVDIFALSLYGLMVFPRALGYVDEATTDLVHRLSKRVTSIPAILAETFRSLGACRKAGAGRIFCRGMLSGELHRWFLVRYFIDAVALIGSPVGNLGCHWLCPFARAEAAWIETVRTSNSWLKGVAISPATTPKYVEWRSQRINDNVPLKKMEEAQPMEGYLQEYKKAQVSLKRVGLGRSSEQWQKEVQEEKARAEYWERKFQEMRSQNLALEKENKGLKTKNDMRKQMLEAQRNMMAEMAQLLRATDKGKAPMAITGEEGEDHPPGFTPPHVPLQA
ncbi:hypothetical protein CXB51_004518 [Gossypium anomalum]|uniref:DUF7745 domain-containing protein n=1 Tax=Gossypium anomalum TaxID=47600 RepID=A0A8J5ZZK0_9ROSI|nr:hypothetical protein CXB51_004518 [Gossypium anomalum]